MVAVSVTSSDKDMVFIQVLKLAAETLSSSWPKTACHKSAVEPLKISPPLLNLTLIPYYRQKKFSTTEHKTKTPLT